MSRLMKNILVMSCKIFIIECMFVCLLSISNAGSSSRHTPLSSIQRTNDPQPITESIVNKSYKEVHDNENPTADDKIEYIHFCPSNVDCNKLGGECITCKFNYTCVYGEELAVECEPRKGIDCLGERSFNKTMICRYCYQTETWEHYCFPNFSCRVVSNPRERELTNCSVRSDVICLGNRRFRKNPLCNWTDGYKWSTALILSITLGGFGADRFYLGHWQEGIGKLFSFGGLGIWTLLDVILISVGYLSPADGSLYI